ncbi:LuxR C-terminal-related transcriptional regulator [Aeromicrobium fastidiosum]|uniref:LuxR C-terminal-related transcriptional regulator n=1 Tax=Aeromicrobium fastidiosum TaxID=52699 RepID=UPI001AEA186E|nr:LuxR C-terminal-related transcriptional regulator [Aeromicrobium fastidiosum]MBP2390081.1 DNA-binding NarL/FixJ family response regulator [Aeromicrobium fastidiosum]
MRVASVDDDTVVRAGLPLLLPMFDFEAQLDSVEALLAERVDVDVVLLDLELDTSTTARSQGGAAVRAVSDAGYNVLIYTNERRREVLAGCLSKGARGVVGKTAPIEVLERAVIAVGAGEVVMTQTMVGLVELADHRGLIGGLTTRQREVLSARARGESFASIGERLFISARTAEDHWANVANTFADYLATHSAADLERHLGLGPGDLLDD